MRGVGAAAAMVVATSLVAGCGWSGVGHREAASPKVTTSISPTPAKSIGVTVATVRRDLRVAVAAAGFEGLKFIPLRPEVLRQNPCQVVARVETDSVPKRAATDKIVAGLRLRGWTGIGPYQEPREPGQGYILHHLWWDLNVTAGSVSKEQMAARLPIKEQDKAFSFTGIAFYGIERDCRTTPSPSASPRSGR
jgi:hypothetical protein